MRILIIKQLFHPEPTARSLDFAQKLVERGHEVQVITGFPSYPKGKIYPGFRQRLFHREMMGEIEVIRVPIFPDQSGRAIYRILNYLSYAISAVVFGIPRAKKADVAFAYHGALPVGVPAMVNKWFRGVPFVYDINDIWPDTLEATGMLRNRTLLKIVEKWCNFTYRQANRITVLSEGFRQKLISRGVPPEKVVFINQWSRNKAITEDEIPRAIADRFPNQEVNVIYAGNLGKAQSLFNVVDAFDQVQEELPNLSLTLLGDGVDRKGLIEYVQDRKIPNVRFIDRVPTTEVNYYLKSADALLVHLKDDPLFRITIPSKIIGCHQAGRPILLGIKGDAEEVIRSSRAGFIFEPDDVEDLKRVLRKLVSLSSQELKVMGTCGSDYYRDNFTIDANVDRFAQIFDQVATPA